jgi:hypothetical protein
MQATQQRIYLLAAFLCVQALPLNSWAQGVNVETRSGAVSQNNVRVQGGDGNVSVDSFSGAASQSNVRVQGGNGNVNVDSRSGAASQNNVSVQGGNGNVSVDSFSGAASQSNVRVQGGAPGQSIDVNSGAAAATQNRVRVDNGGAGVGVDSRAAAGSQSNVRVYAPDAPAPVMSQPDATVPVSPQPPVQKPVSVDTQAGAAADVSVQATTRPVNCEKIEDVTIDEMSIKVINKSCRGKIMSVQAWRENGKTKVQFIFDNKGFSNTTLKMQETWFDRRGRAINETIDEQKFAVEAGHNKAVVITGPVPQAMTAVITFYR